jgi:hypothetical protein
MIYELNFMFVLFLAVVYTCFMITEKHNVKCKKKYYTCIIFATRGEKSEFALHKIDGS